jgi:hypothetical protein
MIWLARSACSSGTGRYSCPEPVCMGRTDKKCEVGATSARNSTVGLGRVIEVLALDILSRTMQLSQETSILVESRLCSIPRRLSKNQVCQAGT